MERWFESKVNKPIIYLWYWYNCTAVLVSKCANQVIVNRTRAGAGTYCYYSPRLAPPHLSSSLRVSHVGLHAAITHNCSCVMDLDARYLTAVLVLYQHTQL